MLVGSADYEGPETVLFESALFCQGLFFNTSYSKLNFSTVKSVKLAHPFSFLTLFLPFTINVVCSLIFLCTLVTYIENNVDADQTDP